MPSILLSRDFQQGHCYHLRHQTTKESSLFFDQNDYKSFILTLSYYLRFPRGTPLSWVPRLNTKTITKRQQTYKKDNLLPCTLHAFLLLPTHFHLVLTENLGGEKPGISELMRRLSVGYAMTYRKKYGGKGTIYQGKYKMLDCTTHLNALINWLHSHPQTNQAYLRDPSHSSLNDYLQTPRPWLKPISLTANDDHLPLYHTLEKVIDN